MCIRDRKIKKANKAVKAVSKSYKLNSQSTKMSAYYMSIADACKNWLQALPSQVIIQNETLQRLQEVLELLQTPSSRQQRQKIFKLLGNWDVRTKTQRRKRKYDEIKVDLVAKIVEEARRWIRMRHEFDEPCSLNKEGYEGNYQ